MFEGQIEYAPDAAVLYPSLQHVSEHQVMRRKQSSDATGRPFIYATRVKPLEGGVGTKYELVVDPTPDDAYELTARYKSNPAGLSEDVALPFGGQMHAQTVIEAVLSAAEEQSGEQGLHSARFLECLRASVSHDQRASSPKTLGYNYDPSDTPIDGIRNWHDWDENVTTYNGVEY